MLDILKSEALKIVKQMSADDVEYKGTWNGYYVFDIIYNEHVIVGYPLVILANTDEMRLSTREECIQFWRDYTTK